MKIPRLYLDTSVIGGCFDDEFLMDSLRLVEGFKSGRAILVLSDTVFEELVKAPAEVQEVLKSIPSDFVETLDDGADVAELREAYLSAKILNPRYKSDADHVAYATIARVDAIVSWNFKHLVRFDKIRLFNQVNLQNGFGMIQIVSPKEVLFDE